MPPRDSDTCGGFGLCGHVAGGGRMEENVELLLQGCRYGDEDDVREAVEAGAAVTAVDGQGRTGLHMASANGHLEIVRWLVDRGADVNARNVEESTPLHWAAVNGHSAIVEFLMQHGADPAALNRHERTPVDEAVGSGHMNILEIINAQMVLRDTSNLNVNGNNESREENEEQNE